MVEQAGFGGFPTSGSGYGLLSTGHASSIGQPNAEENLGADLAGGNVRGDSDFDVTILRVDLDVPATANCLNIDFRFLSEEYEEYVGTDFNDAFLAELDSTTWATSGSSISRPDNFAFDPAGSVISVNGSGYTSMSSAGGSGTTYDGGTPRLQARTQITPGAHQLYLSVFDQGDAVYDSTVLLDNLIVGQAAPEDCTAGAQPGDDCETNVPPTVDVVFGRPVDWSQGSAAVDPSVEVMYSANASDPDGQLTAESFSWSFVDSAGQETAAGQAVQHEWLTGAVQGQRTATLTVTDACGATASRTVSGTITGNPTWDFAPVMRLHPNEKWYPLSVSKFLAQSSLRYVREYPKQPDDDVKIVGRGNVKAASLGSGVYGAKVGGKTYKTDDLTRPYLEGNAGPTKKSGFYLDLNDDLRPGSPAGTWPVYFQAVGTKIVYWLFYPYSQPHLEGPKPLKGFGHEGDWERVIVDLDESFVPTTVGYVAHHEPVDETTYLGLVNGMAAPETVGFNPVGYVALGGHGTYASPGARPTCDPVKGCLWDYAKKGGTTWHTNQALYSITTQGWFGRLADHGSCQAGAPMPADALACGFGGAWGHRGSLADLTGPLGPSAYKAATENH